MRKLLAALPLFLLACTHDPQPVDEFSTYRSEIKGGQTDAESKAVVGMFSIASGGLCTGSLIAPNLVLTAHHCVARIQNDPGYVQCGQSKFNQPAGGDSYYVTTDTQMSQQGNWYQGASIHVPPGGNDTCGYDVALIILAQNMSPDLATPMIPRVDTKTKKGETYTAIGFGNTDDYNGAGRRRIRSGLKIDCGEGQCLAYRAHQNEWIGQTGICSGDSGGPALDDKGRVIGVVSRGIKGCDSPVYGAVYSHREWIREIGAKAAKQGGYAEPEWVATGNSEPPPDVAPEPEPEPEPEPGPVVAPGSPCDEFDQCADGTACAHQGDPSKAICTNQCSSDADCSAGNECNSFGACFPASAANGADGDAGQASGCAAQPLPMKDPGKPVPWVAGLGLLAFAAMRRRR